MSDEATQQEARDDNPAHRIETLITGAGQASLHQMSRGSGK